MPLFVDFSVVHDGVGSFEIFVEYDNSTLEVQEITNEALENIELILIDDSTFKISWNHSLTVKQGSQFNGKLLDIVFSYVGGDTELLFLPEFSEVKNLNNRVMDVDYQNGVIEAAVVSLELSTITAVPGEVNVCQTSLIIVQLKNSSDEHISGSAGAVTLYSNLGALSDVYDNNDGTYTATLSVVLPVSAGTATVTGQFEGDDFEDYALVEIYPEPALFCPDNIFIEIGEGSYGDDVFFAANTCGTPTPTLTYMLGDVTITPPYFFSTGIHQVDVFGDYPCGVLSCSFLVEVVLANINLSDEFIDETRCYGATGMITIHNSTVSSLGNLTLIAGKTILFFSGFDVERDGHLHAYISNVLCENPTPLVVSKTTETIISEKHNSRMKNDTFIKIYPNPTAGIITLELSDNPDPTDIAVEIYNIVGEKLLSAELRGSTRYDLDLGSLSRGVYIIRVLNGENTGLEKMIRH
ncbi:MAG TPA: T9SS type A sorting domain-containing protein [Bacteroidales bacterium]|nr:T9SS type A sorting domain-containing protein [Bacteroidales bacterium]